MLSAAVLGAGSWGTALAILLSGRGHRVGLWARSAAVAEELRSLGENQAYLPGHRLPRAIAVTSDLSEALTGADVIFVAVPVQHIRSSLGGAGRLVGRAALRVGASKGIERITLLRMSQLLDDVWGPGPYAVLSGPSFAVEVVRGEPTAVTLAGRNPEGARALQAEISSGTFRVYTTDDVVGVELAGALKNVIAIAAGIVRGLGLGSNARAALLTRGLAEVRRLGVALGGRGETFLGLAGVGDLVLTCTGELSRNLRVGEAIASGRALDEILAGARTVAEGVETARSALALAQRHDVDMPIAAEVVAVLFQGRDPRAAMRSLMGRDLKPEEGVE